MNKSRTEIVQRLSKNGWRFALDQLRVPDLAIALACAATSVHAAQPSHCPDCQPNCPPVPCPAPGQEAPCDPYYPQLRIPDSQSAPLEGLPPDALSPNYGQGEGVMGDGALGEGAQQSPMDLGQGADAASNPASSLPSGEGAVAAAESPGVHMIGDFFSSGYFIMDGDSGSFASVPISGADRRFKATDNLSPFPQDRVFFNYHHFHNSIYDADGLHRDVNRYTLGIERTFFDQLTSLELRLPISSGLAADQDPSAVDNEGAEFGNIAVTAKTLLWRYGALSVATGLATVVPTADDGTLLSGGSFTVVENNAVHLQPYLGVNWSDPCSRWFTTSFIGVDVDVNGNEVFFDPGGSVPALRSLGTIRDQTLLFVDWQVGYWWYRDYGHIGYLNAIAPVFEVHYSQMLEDPQNFDGIYENPFGTATLVNMTGGLVFDFRRMAQVTVYGAAPLRREEAVLSGFGATVSPTFQAEVGVQCVYRY